MNMAHFCLVFHRLEIIFIIIFLCIFQGVIAESIQNTSKAHEIFQYNNPLTQSSPIGTPILKTTGFQTTIISTTPTISAPIINSAPVPNFSSSDVSILLNPGWNFISTPVPLKSGKNTLNILKDINTRGHSLYGFDPVGGWTKLNSSDLFQPLIGIWIYSVSQISVPLEYDTKNSPYPDGIYLKKGWNAIGTSTTTTVPISEFLSSVKDKWVFFVAFNSLTQTTDSPLIRGWKSDPNTEQFLIQPGKGYWLFMNSDGFFSRPKKMSDIQVSGTVAYNTVSDDGWKFSIPGTVKGSISPNTGEITIESTDAFLTYAGKKYPIKMNINALMNQ